MSEKEFDPSLHVLPLKPKSNTPFLFINEGEESGTVVGFTTDGRISFLPIPTETVLIGKDKFGKIIPLITSIHERINSRFPHNKDIYGNKVKQYLVAAIVYIMENGQAAFIFEVWGSTEAFKELEALYDQLASLGRCKIGDRQHTTIQEYFYSDPVKRWINELISFLKQQLDWTNYVRESIDSALEQK